MKQLSTFLLSILAFANAGAQNLNRFPKPDFESGYQYPDAHYALPNEQLWLVIDIILLVGLMSFVAWAVIKKQTRKPIIWVSIISVAYFGFFRSGCVCSIGSIQNVALAFVDSSYAIPLSVFLFFILPIVFAFLFGRVFCAGVCPFGALQELVNIRNYRLSKSVTAVLEVIPWLYLIFAILYAVTRTSFIICLYDPFIGIFRLGGDFGLILFGVVLLIASVFTGRPFCRFICPYGALLSLFSKVSIWKIQITKQACINCELCHNACPVDAIKPPYENKTKEERLQGVKRLIMYFIFLPLMIGASGYVMHYASPGLSKAHKDVKLYNMLVEQEANPQVLIPIELEAFYSLGGEIHQLKQEVDQVKAKFEFYSLIAGLFIGLVLGLALIKLSVKRSRKEYEIEHDDCVACGKCFSYCPKNTFIIPENLLQADETNNI
ncbi:4Fe-4S binding protein [Carboxylicivirga sp. M1479]|uniref:4Fe-4S binding protein n=1 Tax=Carboxylicivirga sp. M1479 TaxID=2594476 RepID=UPI00117851E1|nr:4Fe-4S binding protein [Carboxylicivirga sp. M1479]TRX70615.1 4Fe-4S binding protein [Carboxylicivirga sp. M1479]